MKPWANVPISLVLTLMATRLILLINNSTKYVTIVKSCFWLFKAATLKTMRATSAPSKEQDYYVHKYATKNKKKTQEAISRQLSASLPLPGKYYKYQLTQEKNATLLVNFRPHYFEHYVWIGAVVYRLCTSSCDIWPSVAPAEQLRVQQQNTAVVLSSSQVRVCDCLNAKQLCPGTETMMHA